MMIVLICGSRDWADSDMIEAAIFLLSHGSVVVHGACRGADMIADGIAKNLLYEVRPYPADWNGPHKRGAGPIRNQKMLDTEQPDEVWAFHDDRKNSRGTRDMILRAQDANVPVILFSHEYPAGVSLQPPLSLW